MKTRKPLYHRHRFPQEIIRHTVWLYYRFNLSHRDIEDLLAERGITVTRESIRLWCIKFGALYAQRLKRKHRGYGDTFFIDEVFVKINGKQHYLWRAVDQDGEVVDVYLQAKRDGAAAKRFFKRLLRSHGGEPRKIVTEPFICIHSPILTIPASLFGNAGRIGILLFCFGLHSSELSHLFPE